MNKHNATHAKAIARKIRMQAESLARSMQAIEAYELDAIPLETILERLGALPGSLKAIQAILDDMLPRFERKE